MIRKGKVSTILSGGAAVTATAYAGGAVTAPLTVPQSLFGMLPINTPILYVTFEDNTGVVLSRMDGVSGGGAGNNGGFEITTDGDAIVVETKIDAPGGADISADGDAIVINTGNSTVSGGV